MAENNSDPAKTVRPVPTLDQSNGSDSHIKAERAAANRGPVRSVFLEGERWINVGDLLDLLRASSDTHGALASFAGSLEEYSAKLDTDYQTGGIGRRRFQLVTDPDSGSE